MEHHQFYEVLPDGRYKFRVDHHTINDFNTCDRYFQFRHMPDHEGMVWGTKGTSIKIAIGQWWANVMESYYHEMQFGTLPSEHLAMRLATDAWVSHSFEHGPVCSRCGVHQQADATLLAKPCMDHFANADPEVFDKFGGLDGAKLMMLEYHMAFGGAHYNQWHIVGAELGFGWRDELLLGEDDEIVVQYGGKPDLVIIDKAQNMIMPLDFKTKDSVPANAALKYKPHPQTVGYIFAVRKLLEALSTNDDDIKALVQPPKPPTKCVILVCARNRPTDKPRSGIRQPRFLPVYPNYSMDEIEEWRVSIMEKCRRLRDSIKRNYFPPRESACHLYYHGCAFRRVCSTPAASREVSLKADFIKIEPWKPYTPDED